MRDLPAANELLTESFILSSFTAPRRADHHSPTTATTVPAGDPSIEVSWDLDASADTMYGIVQFANGPGINDDEGILEIDLAETTTNFVAENLPTDKQLMFGVAASQKHHHRSSSNATVKTELELVTFSSVFIGNDALHSADGIGAGTDSITQAELDSIVDAAIERLATAGLNEQQVAVLESTTIQIADLDETLLGVTQANTITIDIDGAGHGWYIDSTPAEDSEFDEITGDAQLNASAGEAASHMDLLTTVMHELGHVLGLDDNQEDDDELMFESLGLGTRRWLDDDLVSLLASG